ncbi:branched-chain amino acid transport system ATP-binding protein [Frankia sp. Hr75.2]|nr:branched-chain amino acid transport system ATP-binding protein [Frankia sp. Hr75.2]
MRTVDTMSGTSVNPRGPQSPSGLRSAISSAATVLHGEASWQQWRPIRHRQGMYLVVLFAIAFGLIGSEYWQYLGVVGAQQALLVFSVGMLFNRAGILMLCPLSFAALGAWVAGWFTVHYPVPFLLLLPLAALAAVPVGLVIGLLAMRLRGMNFAIATIAVISITQVLLGVFPVPGLSTGKLIKRPDFAVSQQGYYFLCLAVVAVVFVAVSWLISGRSGAAWMMLRSERAVAGAGSSVLFAKIFAFCVSAAVASVAGVLLLGQQRIVDSSSFGMSSSLQYVLIAIMLGAGHIEGALVGAVAQAFMPELMLRIGIPTDLLTVFFAVGAIQILGKRDDGIAGANRAKRAAKRAKRAEARALLAPSAVESPAAVLKLPAARHEIKSTDAAAQVSSGPVLDIAGLSVRYGAVAALNEVTLQVPERAVVGLIGPNGAGKSTLLDACTGFVPQARGTIVLAGERIDGLAPRTRARRGLVRTFQHSRVAPELPISQYVEFIARRRLTSDELHEVLALLGCTSPPDTLLGNMDVPARRLVEVAAAVTAKPAVLMLDEPAAGLAEAESLALAERLAALPERFGMSIVLVEHDMKVVMGACQQLTVLDHGEVIANGDPAEVLAAREVQFAYLGSAI